MMANVDILINDSPYATVTTYGYGYYSDTLQVPYWFTPELELQALYYPRDKDIGVYTSSLSPVIKFVSLVITNQNGFGESLPCKRLEVLPLASSLTRFLLKYSILHHTLAPSSP
jgi:hypothetical protein